MTSLYYRQLTEHVGMTDYDILLPEVSSLLEGWRIRRSPSESSARRTHFLDFQSLHRMNVVHLQDQLIKESNEIITSKTTGQEQLERVKSLLRDHTEAVSNLESVFTRPVVRDGFGPHKFRHAGMSYRFLSSWEDPVPWRFSSKVAFGRRRGFLALAQRAFMALLGGAALVVPMLVMTTHPTQTKSLVTTSIAVFIFALAMAIGSPATSENVLGVTAAYAAVLVVFVGTQT